MTLNRQNTYIIKIIPAEADRLCDQMDHVLQAQGGPFPGRPELPPNAHILDVACGSGRFVEEVAFAFPTMQITGIDISPEMISAAKTRIAAENAHFVEADIIQQPWGFPDDSFDLVNGSCISTFLPKHAWPLALQECYRVLKPGGVMQLTDLERAISTSIAHERCSTILLDAVNRTIGTFAPDGLHSGLQMMMPSLLKDANFQAIESMMYAIDYSFGTQAHAAWVPTLLHSFLHTFPLLEALGHDRKELERLYVRAETEMYLSGFHAMIPYMTAWGIKK